MDWIDDPSGKLPHNYDSAGVGGNRFSTILMYMSDLDENAGGETVFTEAWPVGVMEEDRVDLKSAITSLRESGATDGILERGSWEEEMVAYCRTRLAIRPSSGRAVLFYSQLPNGEPDPASKHGGWYVINNDSTFAIDGCSHSPSPVLKGEKYASNLWVWNTIRDGYEGAPRNPNARQSAPTTAENEKKIATFTNNGLNPMFDDAELFYGEEMFWSKLGKGHPAVAVNTFPGHVWILKVNGEAVKKWQITADQSKFNFEI
jgi:2OG-Fe(II) oxygenase superfamily